MGPTSRSSRARRLSGGLGAWTEGPMRSRFLALIVSTARETATNTSSLHVQPGRVEPRRARRPTAPIAATMPTATRRARKNARRRMLPTNRTYATSLSTGIPGVPKGVTLPASCVARSVRPPFATDVGCALLVLAVRTAGDDEPVPLVEPACAGVRLEGPELEPGRPLPLRDSDETRAVAPAEVIRIDVEVVDPFAVEHEQRGDAPALVDDPHVHRCDDDVEVGANLIIRVNGFGDGRHGRCSRSEPHSGDRTSLLESGPPGFHPHIVVHNRRSGRVAESIELRRSITRMPRKDTASRVIAASPERVYGAFVDPEALVVWLPPEGMSGRFERFDLRPGGSYRMVLTYADASGSPGKATAGSDVVEARLVDVVPGTRVVQAVDFVSGDPAYAGTMTMTWEVTAVDGGTRVDITADEVPDGISAEDHAAGLASSLTNLADHLER